MTMKDLLPTLLAALALGVAVLTYYSNVFKRARIDVELADPSTTLSIRPNGTLAFDLQMVMFNGGAGPAVVAAVAGFVSRRDAPNTRVAVAWESFMANKNVARPDEPSNFRTYATRRVTPVTVEGHAAAARTVRFATSEALVLQPGAYVLTLDLRVLPERPLWRTEIVRTVELDGPTLAYLAERPEDEMKRHWVTLPLQRGEGTLA